MSADAMHTETDEASEEPDKGVTKRARCAASECKVRGAEFGCPRCGLVFYCSEACQLKDAEEHTRLECKHARSLRLMNAAREAIISEEGMKKARACFVSGIRAWKGEMGTVFIVANPDQDLSIVGQTAEYQYIPITHLGAAMKIATGVEMASNSPALEAARRCLETGPRQFSLVITLRGSPVYTVNLVPFTLMSDPKKPSAKSSWPPSRTADETK